MDTNAIKAVNEAVYDFATSATKKTMEMQTAMFRDWMALNKKLWEMTPAKDMFTAFQK
ncbi:hypothetical protein UFOVP29_170 [uncultured Caudovirales phage]|uniref:Uncharacterized protein n=1 Tax=uncultured Caudovirales phage TaxID=2100421 RepID=A0A6J5KMJ7_9CAUD|nr:hypothetical protein UFOVP29_170 [uncultured Caudovirales phage]